MTIEEILDEFKDINHAYNNSIKHDQLKKMLEELVESATKTSSLSILYPCDSSKNYGCDKYSCKELNVCSYTSNKEFMREDATPDDYVIVDHETGTIYLSENKFPQY